MKAPRRAWWRLYFRKWLGTRSIAPPRIGGDEIFWSWVGGVAGIGTLAWIGKYCFDAYNLHLLIGSFGASAVLVFGAPRSPLAQPRNLIGGHALSALIGVIFWQLLHDTPMLAQALAVASAIAVMHLSRTLHPPGGATALIATLGSAEIQKLGYWYVLWPATVGPLVLLLVALLINNLPLSRRYPVGWW